MGGQIFHILCLFYLNTFLALIVLELMSQGVLMASIFELVLQAALVSSVITLGIVSLVAGVWDPPVSAGYMSLSVGV